MHRILVVDDEEPILFAMQQYLSPCGYDVQCAREREEAEALLSYVEYDLVIADLRLSALQGTEGLEILTYVKSRRPETPVVLLTAYGSPAVEAEARRRGSAAFLRKPQPLAKIAATVRRLVEAADEKRIP